jgi:3D (Asp-Asp-Asp) domain-containing protein
LHANARYLASCVAALVLTATSGLALGAARGSGGLASLAATERAAAVELFAAEVALARARAAAERHAHRERSLERARARLRARAVIVQRSLQATHVRIARLLRRLYVEGEADPIAVVLGARSLDAVLEGVDGLERATRRNRSLAAQARSRTRALEEQLGRLQRARRALAETRSRAEAATVRLASAAAQKRATVAALERRSDLTAARLAAETREAERAAEQVEATPAAAAEPAPSDASAAAPASVPAAAGTRTLVVDAVAYHLPGRTASGLPVGVGVIAVDPSVIPLGTRLFVPGYGPAVAADTGSAIRGNIIDLWMPTTVAARAWGRRTVTITLYG